MANIFRKKSLDKVNSPDDLNEYMRVTNPPIWFALIAIIILLTGAIIWGCAAKLETKVSALIYDQDNNITCYTSASNINKIKTGMTIKVNNEEYTISSIDDHSVTCDSVLSEYAMELGKFKSGESIYALQVEGDSSLSAGYYSADIIIESISPISYLFTNSN